MSAEANGVRTNGPSSGVPATAAAAVAAPGIYPPGPGTVIYMPVASVSAAAAYDYCENYKQRQSIGIGACQVLIGILCVIFNAVGLGFAWNSSNGMYIGHGFWSGVFFIITGSLGMSAGRTKTRCKIIAFMTTCILSACCATPLLAISVIGAVIATPIRYYNCDSYSAYYTYYYTSCNDTYGYRVVVAMQSLMAILALIEASLAIWGSAIGCRAVCCCTPVATHGVIVPANYLPSNGQVMYVNQSQGTSYIYSHSPAYPMGQVGPAADAVGPPPYQASFAQAAWTTHGSQTHSNQPPLLFPSAPDYDGIEHRNAHPINQQNPHSIQDPPKY